MFKKIIIILICMAFFCVSPGFASEKFPLQNISVEYDRDSGVSIIQGELTNNSGKAYATAIFKLSFYKDNKLLGAADIPMNNLEKGETVTFETYEEKDFRGWTSYKIRLDMGA